MDDLYLPENWWCSVFAESDFTIVETFWSAEYPQKKSSEESLKRLLYVELAVYKNNIILFTNGATYDPVAT